MSDHVSEITALTTQLSNDNLALWSDEKKQSFVDTFDARIRVARYILIETADKIFEKALGKHFISEKHRKGLPDKFAVTPSDLWDVTKDRYGYQNHESIGGRPHEELDTIADERAGEIIDQLPRLNDAVRILSPAVSLMIEKKTKLLAKGKEIFTAAEELAGSIDMADLDQDMTLAKFRQMVKDREKKRLSLLSKLDEIGTEGNELESKINKFLYDGLPGLSDAVIKVINDYIDRAAGFSGLNRRVGEQVKFGDSEAAMEMLKTFEKDEVKISTDIKAQFDAALQALKVAAKKGLGAGRAKTLSLKAKN